MNNLQASVASFLTAAAGIAAAHGFLPAGSVQTVASVGAVVVAALFHLGTHFEQSRKSKAVDKPVAVPVVTPSPLVAVPAPVSPPTPPAA